MKSELTQTLNKSAKPEIDLSRVSMIFPAMVINASAVEVIGNWENKSRFLIHLKNGTKHEFANIDPATGVHMYLAALSGQSTDYRSFERSEDGYGNGGGSGLLLMPDYEQSFLAARAGNIIKMRDESKKKKIRTCLYTFEGRSYTVECRFEDFAPAYQRALQGEHVALWPENWPENEQLQLNKTAPKRAAKTLRI